MIASNIEFEYFAIFDIYKYNPLNKAAIINNYFTNNPNNPTLENFERFISTQCNIPCRNIFSTNYTQYQITNRWESRVIFGNSGGITIDHYGPKSSEQCMFGRLYKDNRFLYVNIPNHPLFRKNNNIYESDMSVLFNEGILFGQRRYKFLGGKVNSKKSKTRYSKIQNQNDIKFLNSDNGILAWFFAEAVYPHATVQHLRDLLGNFEDSIPSKINSRISLGFSKSISCSLSGDQIEVIKDITSCDNSGAKLTDGCGYIAVSETTL